jgi:hypothetical protein
MPKRGSLLMAQELHGHGKADGRASRSQFAGRAVGCVWLAEMGEHIYWHCVDVRVMTRAQPQNARAGENKTPGWKCREKAEMVCALVRMRTTARALLDDGIAQDR